MVCRVNTQRRSNLTRSPGLPDRGYFGSITKSTRTPLPAVWLSVLLSIIPGLLDLASPIAANAIFSLTAIALDLSYIIPIFLRRLYRNHPEVVFKPGPFYMPGLLGWAANITCITYVLSPRLAAEFDIDATFQAGHALLLSFSPFLHSSLSRLKI